MNFAIRNGVRRPVVLRDRSVMQYLINIFSWKTLHKDFSKNNTCVRNLPMILIMINNNVINKVGHVPTV